MGLSLWHLLLIIVILLLLFGPARLPSLGKSLGEAIRGFKKGLDDKNDKEIDVTNTARNEQIHEADTRASSTHPQQETKKDKV